jgi:hypothetical protein
MQLTRFCVSSLALHGRYLSAGAARFSSSGPRASLLTEEGKAFHALGYNIGTQYTIAHSSHAPPLFGC